MKTRLLVTNLFSPLFNYQLQKLLAKKKEVIGEPQNIPRGVKTQKSN